MKVSIFMCYCWWCVWGNGKLSTCKATQITDFPVKILKKNVDMFTDNYCVTFSPFLWIKADFKNP